MLSLSIVGGAGYVGGELLRLALGHPEIEIKQVISRSLAGRFVHTSHPNLRGATDLKYQAPDALEKCDLLILALAHGEANSQMDHFASLASKIIDCSADFRLRDSAAHAKWYGPDGMDSPWRERFCYGLPEAHREELRSASYVSGVGCNATAVNLALLPLMRAEVLDLERGIVAEIKAGSSEGGSRPSASGHHPERSGVVRSFAPVGHRHTAEVRQLFNTDQVFLSVTSIEAVRGASATCQAFLKENLTDRDLWGIYREYYGQEPFVRIVHDRGGAHRHPEAKVLSGSNFADVGWAVDPEEGRIVALSAIDNLVKGAAGSAIQAANLMFGFEEKLGLGFLGLHPV